MKKVLSLLTVSALAAGVSVCAAAAPKEGDPKDLPFELTAPENVVITYLDGNDSPNTCQVAYSQSDSMSAFFSRKDDPEEYEGLMAELNKKGIDDIWVNAQMDWSIDTQDDWHYNQYWDSEGYDEDYRMRLGEWAYISLTYSPETTNEAWVFRYMGNINDPEDTLWYGRHNEDGNFDGWKDVLKEDQYDVIDIDDAKQAKIDLTKHTIYVRMRWLVTTRFAPVGDEEGYDTVTASDWSEIASVGKDSDSIGTLDKKTFEELVKPPVISNFRMTDEKFNDQPIVAFTLDVPDDLKKTLTSVTANGGTISLRTEMRIKDKTDWTEMQGDWTVKSGEMKVTMVHLVQEGEVIDEGTPVELRCRYDCYQPDSDDLVTDYSEVLTFGTTELDGRQESAPEESRVSDDEPSSAQKDEYKCKVCGICPVQPLGICLFIWIAIIVVLAIVVIVVVIVVSKNKKKEN